MEEIGDPKINITIIRIEIYVPQISKALSNFFNKSGFKEHEMR